MIVLILLMNIFALTGLIYAMSVHYALKKEFTDEEKEESLTNKSK